MDPRIAYLSTYPPRRCGIATFTRDLRTSVGLGGPVFALGPTEGAAGDRGAIDLPEVRSTFDGHEPLDYRRAAAAINGSSIDVLSLQHEYGIFGGPDGVHVLDLVERLETPVVATLHTVLPRPSERQREIVRTIAGRAGAVVVMSNGAARLLADRYGVDPARIRTIPHGVPDLGRADPALRKPEFGVTGVPTILSFGLIGPGKGYELVIEAMPAVRDAVPDAVYVILGATHPDLLRREGEAYRNGLRQRAEELGVADRIRFEDRFVTQSELGRWLQASDVFVTPYPNLDQIVSGTLSYALGAGLAIVSTPYLYAEEVLARGRGVIVPPNSPAAMGEAIVGLLRDQDRRLELSGRAYASGRRMTWPTVGAAYRELFAEVVARGRRAPRRRATVQPVHAAVPHA